MREEPREYVLLGTWNVRSIYGAGKLKQLMVEAKVQI